MVLSALGRLSREDALVLVGSNTLPVAGVALWGWSAYELVVFYWAETGLPVAFLFLYFPFFETDAETPVEAGHQQFDLSPATFGDGLLDALGSLPFFGFAMLVTGFLIHGFQAADNGIEAAPMPEILWGLLPVLAVAAGGRFVRFCLDCVHTGPRQRERIDARLAEPMVRMFVVYLFVFVGGASLLFLGGDAVLFLFGFVGVKLIVDIVIELRTRSDAPRAESGPADSPA